MKIQPDEQKSPQAVPAASEDRNNPLDQVKPLSENDLKKIGEIIDSSLHLDIAK